ncbi:MAG: DNA polymerase Y family protein [Pseudomonadota bacterium]
MTKRRIVCVWFPHWPLETWRRAKARERASSFPSDPLARPDRADEIPGEPFALLVPGPHGELLHAVNAAAAANGLMVGLRAADVAAAHPELRTAPADPAYEARALKRLSAWARRWSPLTRPDGPDGIALDVTGCTHLFGGEAELLATMEERFAAQALSARIACAPCHAAAHALARFSGEPRCLVAPEVLADRVATLPIAALGLDAATATLLDRLGLKTVGQVECMPRAALKRRFGKGRPHRDPRDDTWETFVIRLAGHDTDVLTRLDGIHGRIAVPLDPDQAVPRPRIAAGLPEPIFEAETVLAHARILIDRLMGVLETRGEGVRALLVEAFRTDGGRSTAQLRLARPVRDTHHLIRLLAERLADWRAEYGFDALAVEAVATASLSGVQADGFEEETGSEVSGLIDRLSVRLGANAVTRPVPCESHRPDRSELWRPALSVQDGATRKAGRAAGIASSPAWITHTACARPERILDPAEEVAVLYALPEGPPARFTWRRRVHTVARVAGPERIAPEWWAERAHSRARDYYRAEDAAGRRFWLYAEGFVGDERGPNPRWFLHGLFS